MPGFKFAGANSSLTAAGLTVGVYAYSANPTIDKLETTAFDDAAGGVLWETSMPGMRRGGVISVSVRYDSANTLALGAVNLALTLTLESGKTFTCDVWVQSRTDTLDVAGLITETWNLQVTGPITFPA